VSLLKSPHRVSAVAYLTGPILDAK